MMMYIAASYTLTIESDEKPSPGSGTRRSSQYTTYDGMADSYLSYNGSLRALSGTSVTHSIIFLA